jgi:7-carboxy-7-deazaguanine synthase
LSKDTKKIPVVEMFGPTMQGEGLVVGMRTTFIRFGLCDYECTMCDSLHAVLPERVKENARWLTQTEILEELIGVYCHPRNCQFVTFSGGNPCIHDLTRLCEGIREDGLQITVETQGTKCPDWLWGCSYICVSPKGPGMGEKYEQQKMDAFMMKMAGHPGTFIKVVIFDERDLEFAAALAERHVNLLGEGKFWLSLGNPYPPGKDNWAGGTASGPIPNEVLRRNLIERYEQLFDDVKGHPYLKYARFIPQLHVLLWGNKQGV